MKNPSKLRESIKMHKLATLFLALLLALAAIPAHAEAHTRDEVRALYAELIEAPAASPYAEKPRLTQPYDPGSLTDEAVRTALGCVNFLRRLAYIENDVTISPLYALRAQSAALLLAANDDLQHDAPKPRGMDDDLYQTAHTGTMSSNIACINWMREDILITAVRYFASDDGAENLATLGHRRWLLNPSMGATGFGLANSATGLSYAVMYAHDLTGVPSAWESIAWPSRGAFPVELIEKQIAWSVTLNPLSYDVGKSDVSVSISEQSAGEVPLSYFKVDTGGFGAGPCVIFVPDLSAAGIEAYLQNQVWTVTLEGLVTAEGEKTVLSYEVDMISLQPVDAASVEVSERSLRMRPGESAAISAQVIPDWADDLSVAWSSSDESVATVDAAGRVTAVASGECSVEARTANGRSDVCAVTVSTSAQQ